MAYTAFILKRWRRFNFSYFSSKFPYACIFDCTISTLSYMGVFVRVCVLQKYFTKYSFSGMSCFIAQWKETLDVIFDFHLVSLLSIHVFYIFFEVIAQWKTYTHGQSHDQVWLTFILFVLVNKIKVKEIESILCNSTKN